MPRSARLRSGDADGRATSQLQLDSAQSRPMVLTQGPDSAIWFSRGDGHNGRIAADGDTASLPVRTPTGGRLVVGGEGPGPIVSGRHQRRVDVIRAPV
jgi:hypothetical protein